VEALTAGRRTAQFGTERVDTDKDFGDFVVGKPPFKHVHSVRIFADAAQACQPLAVALIVGIVEAGDTGAL
jgi:hypothetical protein